MFLTFVFVSGSSSSKPAAPGPPPSAVPSPADKLSCRCPLTLIVIPQALLGLEWVSCCLHLMFVI